MVLFCAPLGHIYGLFATLCQIWGDMRFPLCQIRKNSKNPDLFPFLSLTSRARAVVLRGEIYSVARRNQFPNTTSNSMSKKSDTLLDFYAKRINQPSKERVDSSSSSLNVTLTTEAEPVGEELPDLAHMDSNNNENNNNPLLDETKNLSNQPQETVQRQHQVLATATTTTTTMEHAREDSLIALLLDIEDQNASSLMFGMVFEWVRTSYECYMQRVFNLCRWCR